MNFLVIFRCIFYWEYPSSASLLKAVDMASTTRKIPTMAVGAMVDITEAAMVGSMAAVMETVGVMEAAAATVVTNHLMADIILKATDLHTAVMVDINPPTEATTGIGLVMGMETVMTMDTNQAKGMEAVMTMGTNQIMGMEVEVTGMEVEVMVVMVVAIGRVAITAKEVT